MVTARHMDIKQFALFAWLPFLASDLGGIFGGYLSPFFHKHARMHAGQFAHCRHRRWGRYA